jgi:glycosyltransferase involved in cell wall biosynthesis
LLRATPRPLQPLVATGALTAIARREGIGLVHTHFGYRAHDVLALARRRSLPLVVSLHGHDVTAFVREWPGHYDAIFERASAVVVPSRFLAAQVERLGAPPAIVHVIPSGVDTALFKPGPLPDGPPTAAFVGRFVEKKGVDVLLAAWPAVRAVIPDARLTLLGFGPLVDMVARHSGADGVELVQPDTGRRAAQVRDVIARATVVVSPSRTGADGDAESLVLANIEAQASGRAVVTTRHGGIPEFVTDGETALVVGENDADALSDALVRVLGDRELAARLGAAGPARVSSLDVRVCSARVDDLYDALVSAPVASR